MLTIKQLKLQIGGILIVFSISGCTLHPVSDSKAVNEGLTYLPWHEAKKSLDIEPGMVLKLTQTSLSQKSSNTRTPVIADFEWQRTLDGKYTRRDLLFLRHLLISSSPDCLQDGKCGDEQLDTLIKDLSKEYKNMNMDLLSRSVLKGALESIKINYEHSESELPLEKMKELLCGVQFADKDDARHIDFKFQNQLWRLWSSNQVFFSGDLKQRQDVSTGKVGWYSKGSAIHGVRMDPSVSIPIMIIDQIDPVYVEPCRTLSEVEEQLGKKDIVVRLKRQGKYWPETIGTGKHKVTKAEVLGDDGYVSVIFQKTGHVGHPGLIYMNPELKDRLLLAPGDTIELDGELPIGLRVIH